MNMKKRIVELDMIKGLGIIYVFMRHICEMTGVNTYWPHFYSIFNSCTECVMFMFIFVSGYVYKSKGSLKTDLLNKVKQLLVPYFIYWLFFTIVYFLIYIVIGDMPFGLFVRNTIGNLVADPVIDIPALGSGENDMIYAFVAYWYVAELFMAFVLFIIIDKLVDKLKPYVKILVILVLFVIAGVLMYYDVGGFLEKTYAADVSYFLIYSNIFGFAALLMIGKLLKEFNVFDIEAQDKNTSTTVFTICLIFTIIMILLYDNRYALQYGKWGQDGLESLFYTTLIALTLSYSLVYISYYLKKVNIIKNILTFIGSNTLEILLLHFGIGELICMIFGFWQDVYHIGTYPAESFAWWHFFLLAILTSLILWGYIVLKKIVKDKWKNRNTSVA